MASTETKEMILGAYPCLESGDISEVLRHAVFPAEEGLLSELPRRCAALTPACFAADTVSDPGHGPANETLVQLERVYTLIARHR